MIILGILVIGFFLVYSGVVRSVWLKHESSVIAQKVEAFRVKNGTLPESLDEIGVPETLEGPIFYKRESSSSFILWFGEGLGDSQIYNSITKTWRREG